MVKPGPPADLARRAPEKRAWLECADGSVYLNSRNESLGFRGYRAWDRSDNGGDTFFLSGYSDLDTLDDDTILCLYEASEPGASHSEGKLVFARFNRKWLTAG